jgi:cytochrome c oxidase cbb3-type subunit III
MRKVTVVLAFAALAGAAWFVNPPEGSAAQSAARVFASKCSGCHGPDGAGNIAGTPNFTSAEWQASRTDEKLAESIKNGKGRIMPAWGKQLTDAQIAGLVQHIRSLKK